MAGCDLIDSVWSIEMVTDIVGMAPYSQQLG